MSRFAGAADARAVDFGALGAAMSGLRGGFSEGGPVHFSPSPEPKHFRPANPGMNPTEGWDPFDPLSESPAAATETQDPIAAARAEGFAEGMAAAERMAAERGEADARALAEIAGLLQMMSEFERDALAARLRQTVMFLVTRLVGEVGVTADLLNQRIEAAAALIADSAELAQLRLNPADLALVEGHQPETVTLVGDETIGRGGFRIETRSSAVEDGPTAWLNQLAAALDRTALPGE
ncbi:flagellar biosynthesis protein FliH [Sphingomonas sp. ID1715]|uniref:FliH/SctL family protein n=1 Tax=Sphingomonas sp. ID1715 TaxID=1656898 RepID=UPI001488520E|nr:FliH/SctL family protein [Sphingomonas sp. ID1715]NNM76926.1 flagellar biosynthesis protein FliH [Sphingomonas sp. ID1715]